MIASLLVRRPRRLAAGVAAILIVALTPLASASAPTEAVPADPDFGAFFGESDDGLPAFLEVTEFGLRASIRTASVGTTAQCLSDGATGSYTEPIGVNGTDILVGRDGRFSDRHTVKAPQRIETHFIKGSFRTPKSAKGKARVTVRISGPGLSTVQCDSRKKGFSVQMG